MADDHDVEAPGGNGEADLDVTGFPREVWFGYSNLQALFTIGTGTEGRNRQRQVPAIASATCSSSWSPVVKEKSPLTTSANRRGRPVSTRPTRAATPSM